MRHSAAVTDIARLVGLQALYYAAVSVDLTLTALAGLSLAPTPFLATLPLTLITAVGLLASVGAGLLTARFGYRRIMALGAGCAIFGGSISALGVLDHSFTLLCVGTAIVGAYRSTGGYIRYLAADLAPSGRRERALSIVMYGGLIAAIVGPFAAVGTSGFFPVHFVGSYLLVAVIGVVAIPLALTVSREPITAPGANEKPRQPVRLAEARTNPDFTSAIVVLPLAGALMTLVMVMGPLASMGAGHSETDTAEMVQWHLIGMFAPAIFSGELLRRWGPHLTAIVGCVVMGAGAIFGTSSVDVPEMITAMVLVGIAWNLLFLAGTALLVRTYEPGTGGRVQALAEGASGLASVVASLLSAAVFDTLGWQLANTPVILLSAALTIWIAVRWRSDRTISLGGHTPISTE
jgi:MFS family permease